MLKNLRIWSPAFVCMAFASHGCALEKPVSTEKSDTFSSSNLTEAIGLDPSKCEVIINGGTTAALSAALAAARSVGAAKDLSKPPHAVQNPRPGTSPQVCLLEPTDWPGGQLTSAGVSAIDFAWHKYRREMRSVHNNNKVFFDLMKESIQSSHVLENANPGGCWVSAYCDTPRYFLQKIQEKLNSVGNLQIFYNTVVSQVKTQSKTINSLVAIQRSPLNQNGWERPLSEMWKDWYSPTPSPRFQKKIWTFEPKPNSHVIYIDASDTGDFLVLSGASYVQGPEVQRNKIRESTDTCGQSFVFPFAQTLSASGESDSYPIPTPSASFYGFGRHTPEKIWTYRQISRGSSPVTLQNWNPGNDYPFQYYFVPKSQAKEEAKSHWQGGVQISALKEAEAHSLGWHQYYKSNAPNGSKVTLNKDIMGTQNGLSKVPYLRDIRRSIGQGGFFIKDEDIWPHPDQKTGKMFDDSLAIGLYTADFHPGKTCKFPRHLRERQEDIAPFSFPFRAFTNESIGNLLVAGKSMAQTYYVNAATRVQPGEWTSGWAAGTAAAHLWRSRAHTAEMAFAFDPQSQLTPRGTPENPQSLWERSVQFVKGVQYEVVDTQPIWYCDAIGRKEECLDATGRFQLNKPN